MRAWHMWCGLGVVVTITCVVPVREHHVRVKGDFLGVARKGDFLGVTAIGGANVGMAAVGPPIRFDERWDEVSEIAVPDITVRDFAEPDISPLRLPPPATPAPPEPALAMAHAAPEPHEHHAVHRELCAAHGLRREYHRRNGWLYRRCKR